MVSVRLVGIDDALHQALESPGDAFERAYGVSPGAHRLLARSMVAQTLALLQRVPRALPWVGYLAADPARGVLVGTCGFKHGPSADGRVEIAYFTSPEHEGRGYATAMARELLRLAGGAAGVREVVAHTLPARQASTRVLEKVGFHRVAEVDDPEDGKVWQWACRTAPGGPAS